MPDLNDFHAFKSTSSDDTDFGSVGCSTPLVVIGIIALILWVLGKGSG